MQNNFIVQAVLYNVHSSLVMGVRTCTFTLFETLEDFYYIGFFLNKYWQQLLALLVTTLESLWRH